MRCKKSLHVCGPESLCSRPLCVGCESGGPGNVELERRRYKNCFAHGASKHRNWKQDYLMCLGSADIRAWKRMDLIVECGRGPVGKEKYILRNKQECWGECAKRGERGRRRLIGYMRSEGSRPAVAAMNFWGKRSICEPVHFEDGLGQNMARCWWCQ